MRKKKILSLLLVFTMMTWLMPMKVFSTEPTLNLFVTSDKDTAAPGDTITFTLKMGSVEGLSDIAVRCVPSDGLTVTSVTANGDLTSLQVGKFNKAEFEKQANGSVRFNGIVEDDNGYTSNEDTTLGTFVCTVAEGASADQTISLSDVVADDVNFASISTTLNGATTTITAAPVPATGVSLDQTSISLEEGETQQLTATLTPESSTDVLNWSSSDGTKVTVSDTGLLTAVQVTTGIVTITVRAGDSGPTATCTVTVTERVCDHANKTETAAKDPTCTEAGNNKYYYCDDCGKYLKADGTTVTTRDAEAIAALGHDAYYEYNNNSTHYKKCHRCDLNEAENHTRVENGRENETQATCTEPGHYTQKYKCSVCNHDLQSEEVNLDALGHDYQDYKEVEADAEKFGLEGRKCSRCGEIEEGSMKYYIAEGTCPSKNAAGITISESGDLSEASGTKPLGEDKKVEIIVQDPFGVLPLGFRIEIDNVTSDLGADYDGNIKIENAYMADVHLKDAEGNIIEGELPGKVRLLLEIPDDPNRTDDDWDDYELEIQRLNPDADTTNYIEGIEYRLYDADGNFVKVVDSDYDIANDPDYAPMGGETIKKFLVTWTDHFSKYAMIDPEDPVNQTTDADTTSTSGTTDGADQGKISGKSSGLRTGENLNDIYFAGLLLSAAILAIYLSLKKRKEV